MTEIAVCYVLVLVGLLVYFVSRLIFVKKSIYYGWIDTSKKIVLFDYLGDFGGNWIIKSIDYDDLLIKFPGDTILLKKIKTVKLTWRLIIIFLGFLIVGGAIFRIFIET